MDLCPLHENQVIRRANGDVARSRERHELIGDEMLDVIVVVTAAAAPRA